MKCFLLLSVIIMSAPILGADRFDSNDGNTEQDFSYFNEKLVEIKDELKILNDQQWRIIELLSRISNIADQYSIESWDNHPVAPIPYDAATSLTDATNSGS